MQDGGKAWERKTRRYQLCYQVIMYNYAEALDLLIEDCKRSLAKCTQVVIQVCKVHAMETSALYVCCGL